MSRTRKTLVIITGTILLLIVLFFIVLATFDWNRLKPTINQKVSAELNRPFAIRGDLGVVWERQPDERGWRSWIPCPHVHAEDIVLGNPPAIPQVTMIHLPRVEATLAPLALLSKTVYLPWIKLEQPDVRLIRLAEDNNNWTFQLAGDKRTPGDSAPSSWSFRLDNILFDRGTIAIDDKITRSDITILVDPLGKPLPFSEVTGTKDRHSAAKPGDYVFGLSLKGRYKGQPVTGNGKIGGMLALRSASAPFPLQGDFHSGNTRVAFSGTVSDPLNVGGIDLRLKFAGDSLRDLYDLTGVLLPETPSFSTDGRLRADFTQKNRMRFNYQNFNGRIGDSDIHGSLTYTTGKPRPKLSGDMESKQLRLADLGPLIGVDSGKGTKKSASRQAGDRPQPAALRLQGENDIFPHRGSGDNAVGFAILRTEADPEAGSLMRGAQGLRFAFDPRLPAVRRFNAEDHLGGFRASGTQQAGEAYNFSRADLQVERGDGSFFTVAFKRRYRFIAQQGTARPLQGIVVQFATQHHFDQFNLR